MNRFVSDVWRLAIPYFKSEEKNIARLLIAAIIALNLGEVYMSVQFNEWNNGFYNSLQDVNRSAFYTSLIRFSWLAAVVIIIGVYRLYLNQMLQIKWRRWMTSGYLQNWLGHQTYYRMQIAGLQSDNPDQRIADDVDQFISTTLSLTLGLLNSIVTLFSFLFILWTLSGPLAFSVAGQNISIPGYMVWCALVYAVIGTWITVKLGWPLIRLSFEQQRYEANFRYSLIRLRENSESVAFYNGEAVEKVIFLDRFNDIFGNYWAIMKRQKILSWFTSGYYQIAIIFPYIVVAPRYFAKTIKLGVVMQTASAFGQVQGALSFVIGAYGSIANWKAIVLRLTGFNANMEAARSMPTLHADQGKRIELNGLSVETPDRRALLKNVSLTVEAGQSLLIKGPSGCGKTTLLRTIAGLWPFASGQFISPDKSKIMFVPQKPYLPLGSLRDAIYYPTGAEISDNNKLEETFKLCQLVHLYPMLDEIASWSHILSLGEQQRIAFARILIKSPEFILMDEATSALDEASEAYFYGLIKSRFPSIAIISVGHRGTLEKWHDSVMTLGEAR